MTLVQKSSTAKSSLPLIFDTAYSPNNKLLAACSSNGDIYIWNAIEFHCMNSNNKNTPLLSFRAYSSKLQYPVYRLQTICGNSDLLVLASFDGVYIFKWKTIEKQALMIINNNKSKSNENYIHCNLECIHRLQVPRMEYKFGAKSKFVEINSIAFNIHRNSICLGTGHSNIFEYDLNRMSLLNTFCGHSKYILDVSINCSNQVLSSASNDGTVKLWDVRNADQSSNIMTFNAENGELFSKSEAVSSSVYASCCAMHQQRPHLLIGSGGSKSNAVYLLELRMKKSLSQMTNGFVPQVLAFCDGWMKSIESNFSSALVGYNTQKIYRWERTSLDSTTAVSKLKCYSSQAINTSCKSVWSMTFFNENNCSSPANKGLVAISGTGKYIDLIANTGNIVAKFTI